MNRYVVKRYNKQNRNNIYIPRYILVQGTLRTDGLAGIDFEAYMSVSISSVPHEPCQ